jgi:hypothetical protein
LIGRRSSFLEVLRFERIRQLRKVSFIETPFNDYFDIRPGQLLNDFLEKICLFRGKTKLVKESTLIIE